MPRRHHVKDEQIRQQTLISMCRFAIDPGRLKDGALVDNARNIETDGQHVPAQQVGIPALAKINRVTRDELFNIALEPHTTPTSRQSQRGLREASTKCPLDIRA